jgi:hypothetical protein
MNERELIFGGRDGMLEGRLSLCDEKAAAVITHPHPLYGGDMQNPVVRSIADVYRKKGYTTLRFNFRGVGKSQGRYDEGRGEVLDLLAAVSLLRERGASLVHLAGYSFGAWVIAHAASEAKAPGLILVAPPAAMMDFSEIRTLPQLSLVITGTDDAFAPPRLLEPLVAGWRPEAHLRVIEGADHFYFGRFQELEAALAEDIPPARAGGAAR